MCHDKTPSVPRLPIIRLPLVRLLLIRRLLIWALLPLLTLSCLPEERGKSPNPQDNLPEHPGHVDHATIIDGPFPDGPSVTRVCLDCHEDAAREVMATSHWTWEGAPAHMPGRKDSVRFGKKTGLNNYCIGIRSNWPNCTSCHAGYGWGDADFDFGDATRVDCLVCHEQTGTYTKSLRGEPGEDVDLLAAARSVGRATRVNCGVCHFRGGGGNAVKHGDLDESLYYPEDWLDVHMGRHDFACTDCHRTKHHHIAGKALTVSLDTSGQISCTNCHLEAPHGYQLLNDHVRALACQSCHIPLTALKHASKMSWDWSQAGQTRAQDEHVYLKHKGSFVYNRGLRPEYAWYNGNTERYLFGDPITEDGPTYITRPLGGIDDPAARIWPFKVHRGKQVYDRVHGYLLQPQTAGEGGYWDSLDWDDALRRGAETTDYPYSGQYGFTETEMFWTQSHMVADADRALSCYDCHDDELGRMDWKALGYEGDPAEIGGRR